MIHQSHDTPDLDVRADESKAETKRNARILFSSSVAVILLACGYYGFTAKVADPLHIYEGIVIIFLAALPGLLWARSGGKNLPMFEVYMVTTANTYGLPLLSGHESLRVYPAELITYAAFTVILFQSAALLSYFSLRILPGRGPFFTHEVIDRNLNRYIGYGLTLTTAYTCVSIFTNIIPYDINSILRAVFSGIGLVSIFVQSRRWGLGNLAAHEKTAFTLNIAVQVVILFSTLFLVGSVSTLLIALLGYVSGSRRLPFVPFMAFIFVLGLLHNGKSQMRDRYWDADGNHRQPAITELPAFFSEWIECSLTTVPGSDTEEQRTAKLLDRTSLFHLLCLVQSITPEKKPFMDGETYTNLPAQFVPRFFWPGKPPGHQSTYQMSVYYGLQRMEDTGKTTIGFGMSIESYVNFGLPGIIVFGLALGGFYKFVQGRTRNSPLLSYAGIFTIVLIAWSFQTELPLTMWVSSMFQACVALMGLPFIIRNFLG